MRALQTRYGQSSPGKEKVCQELAALHSRLHGWLLAHNQFRRVLHRSISCRPGAGEAPRPRQAWVGSSPHPEAVRPCPWAVAARVFPEGEDWAAGSPGAVVAGSALLEAWERVWGSAWDPSGSSPARSNHRWDAPRLERPGGQRRSERLRRRADSPETGAGACAGFGRGAGCHSALGLSSPEGGLFFHPNLGSGPK